MSWPKTLAAVPAYATGSYPQQMNSSSEGDIFVGLVHNQSNERR